MAPATLSPTLLLICLLHGHAGTSSPRRPKPSLPSSDPAIRRPSHRQGGQHCQAVRRPPAESAVRQHGRTCALPGRPSGRDTRAHGEPQHRVLRPASSRLRFSRLVDVSSPASRNYGSGWPRLGQALCGDCDRGEGLRRSGPWPGRCRAGRGDGRGRSGRMPGYIACRPCGLPRSKTRPGGLQYSRSGSTTTPPAGPRRLARSRTTTARRPGRAGCCVLIATASSRSMTTG